MSTEISEAIAHDRAAANANEYAMASSTVAAVIFVSDIDGDTDFALEIDSTITNTELLNPSVNANILSISPEFLFEVDSVFFHYLNLSAGKCLFGHSELKYLSPFQRIQYPG